MSGGGRAIATHNEEELKLMRKSGEISAKAMSKALKAVKPGVTLRQLDKIAEDEILRLGAKSAFKTVPGYNYTCCININNEVVHGIPRDIVLQAGDIVSIDLGALYHGLYSDTAWTVKVSSEPDNFLKVGEKALWAAIDQAVEGNHIGDISNQIQTIVEGAGYSVVKTLIGHGVGRELHEAPEIPGIGRPGTGPVMKAGMTLAIEVIYTEGQPEVMLAPDGWTIATADGSRGGLFEMSLVVGKDSTEVLTDWRSAG